MPYKTVEVDFKRFEHETTMHKLENNGYVFAGIVPAHLNNGPLIIMHKPVVLGAIRDLVERLRALSGSEITELMELMPDSFIDALGALFDEPADELERWKDNGYLGFTNSKANLK